MAENLRRGNAGSLAYLLTSNRPNIGPNSPNIEIIFTSENGTSGVSADRCNIKVKMNEQTTSKVAGLYDDVVTIIALVN